MSTTMLQAAKSIRWKRPAYATSASSPRLNHGIGSNAVRAFFSATNNDAGVNRCFSAVKNTSRAVTNGANASVSNPNLVRMASSVVVNSNFFADGSSSINGGGGGSGLLIGRSPVGNPSTMAFLGGIRSKSSGAAASFHQDEGGFNDDDGGGYETLVATTDEGASGVGGRSHREAWMVNLGRGDNEEWLSRPRDMEWYTGLEPSICPDARILLGVDEKGVLRSLPLPNLSAVTRQGAKDYFDNSWTLFEMLFAGLKGEEPFYRPPIHGLRHPQIFYYGHTPCLYINKLRVAGVMSQPVHAYFESIFEVGVDEMLWDDMHKNDMVWPTVSEVYEYRKNVYDAVVETIMNHPSLDSVDGKPVVVNQDHPMWSLFMSFEHERIHLETSSVLFRETPIELVQKPSSFPKLHPSVYESSSTKPIEGEDYPSNEMIAVKGKSVQLGKPLDFPSYGWDNEYGERTLSVPDFQASKHMITNGEYYEFVASGGYRDEQYWCEDGWAWKSHRNMKWPFFWKPVGPQGSHEYGLRTIFEEIPMRWEWPVDVTYYESKAFCKWKNEKDGSPTSKPYRVLTEAEHQIIRPSEHNLDAARSSVSADKVMVTSGAAFSHGATGANLNMAYSSHNPVDTFPPSHTGHYDTVGNAWEWTEDHFNPLKNFEVHHVYDDFSTPCFDGKHSMIVGGSFMSTGDEASVYARFHFRPHFLQHSGFRLVASDEDAPATHLNEGSFAGQVAARDEAVEESVDTTSSNNNNVYETDDLLSMYLGLHFPLSGTKENFDPILDHANSPAHGLRFPQRVADLMVSLNPVRTNNRALDVGCAVGGSSFELAKSFDHVEAFDFSDNFVAAAKRIQSGEQLSFQVPIEGDITEEVSVVHEPGVNVEVLSKVNFFQGDACALSEYAESKEGFGTFDGVILANLLCRLPDPMACLNAMPTLVNKGGVVVMVTPFTWLEEFTHRSKWLGGFKDPVSQEPIYSKDKLKEIMEGLGFEKIHEEQMPLVIREHARKYQYIISEATGWRKN